MCVNILRRINKKVIAFLIVILTINLVLVLWPRHLDENAVIRFYNRMGDWGTDLTSVHYWLNKESQEFQQQIRSTFTNDLEARYAGETPQKPANLADDQINLVVVSCGTRLEQGLTMIKSAILFSQDAKLNVIAFTDLSTLPKLGKMLLELKWQASQVGLDFRFELHKTWFPPESATIWKKMYRLCATQRLFFTSLLPNYDSIMFVDADVIFVSNVTQFWDKFNQMDFEQLATMVANDEMPGNGWYGTKSKVPFFGPRGLNAGIMLMNLTRLREFRFEEKVFNIYEEYEERIYLADQDILNILFHFHPEKLLEISCDYNFRYSHCACEHDDYKGDLCKCKHGEETGVSIVHGNQGRFEHDALPIFKNLYLAFTNYDLVKEPQRDLLERLKKEFAKDLSLGEWHQKCLGVNDEVMFRKMSEYIQNMELKRT